MSHYSFVTVWKLKAPLAEVWHSIRDSKAWPAWWEGVLEVTEVVPGDAFIFGPDEPHQLINSGDEELTYYVIADNPIGESGYYPDSGKWKVNKSSAADRVVIKGEETDYFDGEE